MNARLQRAADDVARIERKLYQIQNQKKAAQEKLKLIENEEIVNCIRKLSLGREELIHLLEGIENGSITFSEIENAGNPPVGITHKEKEKETDLFKQEENHQEREEQ